jgi:hypothetical protein
MIDLRNLECLWFDRIYSGEDSGRPSLEKKAALLRGLGVSYSDRQIRDFRSAINQGLHLMRGDCRPSLVVTVYSLITALSLSDQISSSEVDGYIRSYRLAVERKCPDIQQNFE